MFMIGDDTLRGVSGGERKRTSIAVQLLTGTIMMMMAMVDDDGDGDGG